MLDRINAKIRILFRPKKVGNFSKISVYWIRYFWEVPQALRPELKMKILEDMPIEYVHSTPPFGKILNTLEKKL